MAGTVHIPWYATLFRGDKFEVAVQEIAPVALRYGASDYTVYRSRDDRYKFMQLVTFADHADWERYWYGPEFVDWRADYAGWYQVPVLYVWNDVVVRGSLNGAEEHMAGQAPQAGAGDTV